MWKILETIPIKKEKNDDLIDVTEEEDDEDVKIECKGNQIIVTYPEEE